MLVHFYLAWPLLLCALRPRVPGFRARVAAALGAAAAAGTAWRFWAAWRTDFHMPAGDRNLAGEEANLNRILDALYLPTLSRVQEMAVGASLGLLLRSRPALSWVTRRWAGGRGRASRQQARAGRAAVLQRSACWLPVACGQVQAEPSLRCPC